MRHEHGLSGYRASGAADYSRLTRGAGLPSHSATSPFRPERRAKLSPTSETARNGRRLVIVESSTKAKTIKGYLGPGYVVEASVGHIRDLPNGAAEVPAKYKGEPWARL